LCAIWRGAETLRRSAHATARAATQIVVARYGNSASAGDAAIRAFVNRRAFH
jgi:hypothetical protein